MVQRLDALWTQRVVALCEQPVAKGEKEKGKAVQKENVEAEKPADAQASTSSGQGAADTAGVGDMPEVARAADDDASEGLPAKGALRCPQSRRPCYHVEREEGAERQACASHRPPEQAGEGLHADRGEPARREKVWLREGHEGAPKP